MTAPDRIYGWQHSQLSVARFYGRCKVYGVMYRVDLTDPDMPLLRDGVPTKGDEAKAIKAQFDKLRDEAARKAQKALF